MSDTRKDPRSREEQIEEIAALDALEGRRPLSGEDLVILDLRYVKAREGFEAAASALLASTPAEPPVTLKEQLLDRVAAEPASRPSGTERPPGSFDVKPGVTGVRTDEAAWLDADVPGLHYKVINRDSDRGCTTRLLRIEPGHPYPPHRHGGPEEIFLLEGTLWVNGILLKPGDYCRSEAGTEETGTVSDTGALAIVVSSDLDEVDAGGIPA